jgi:hypothetical protein
MVNIIAYLLISDYLCYYNDMKKLIDLIKKIFQQPKNENNNEKTTKEDEEKVKQRLKDLGYM